MTAPADNTAGDAPHWFRNRVVSGLQFLLSLGLVGTPAAELATLTATTWIAALWNSRPGWNEALDNARLEAAFMALAVDADRWPSPRALLDRLPARPQQPRLPPPPLQGPSPEVRERLARLSRRWDDKPGHPGKETAA